MSKKYPLAETFGPTIQGEGNYAGKKTLFIRFAGCDFRCDWCDSKYTHVVKEDTEYLDTQGLLKRVKAINGEGITGNGRKCDHIVITGGNPALYNLSDFIDGLHEMNMIVHIETQGSKWPKWLYKVDNVIISPKAPSSKMYVNQLWLSQAINDFTKEIDYNQVDADGDPIPMYKKVTIKIPIFDDIDYEWAKTFKGMLDMERIEQFFLSVGNHNPHGDDKKRTIIQGVLNGYDWLVEKVLHDDDYKDVSVLPQIHTLLWGNAVGK